MSPTIVLPGQGGEVGAALANLGGTLRDIVNPNYDFRQKFRSFLATNPDIAPKLMDLEKQSPGSLKNLGLSNKVIGNIGKVTATPEMLLSDALKTELQTPENLPETQRQVLAHARGFKNYEDYLASTKRAEQIPVVSSDIAQAGAEQAVGNKTQSQLEAENAVNERTTQVAGQARKLLADLFTKNPEKAKQILLDQNFPEYLQHHMGHERIQAEIEMYNSRSTKDFSDWYKKYTLTTSRDFSNDIKWAGDQKNVYDYLYDDATKARVGDLQSGRTKPQDKRDLDLINIDNAKKNMSDSALLVNVGRIHTSLNNGFAAYDKAKKANDEAAMSNAVTGINSELKIAENFGYPKFKASLEPDYKEYTKPGSPAESMMKSIYETAGIERKVLMLTDSKGNQIKPEDLGSMFEQIPEQMRQLPEKISETQSSTNTSGLSPEASQALELLSDPTIDKELSIEHLRQQDPKLYSELKRAGKI